MYDLDQRILKFIRKERLIDVEEAVLVGVSGGIDSTTLLYILHSLREAIPCRLAVAHLNHMLRGEESERDAAFVENAARTLSLPFHLKKINVREITQGTGKSIQHSGRDARYGFFHELAESYGYQRIAVAHNEDDQVETFILRVTKGTGLRGLSCIPVKRGVIIRPFLNTTRKEIEEYARGKNIPYVEDSSNAKDAYERNYVRHRILPTLEKLNPAVRLRIISLLEDMTQLNQGFEGDANDFLNTHATGSAGPITLPVAELKELNEETRFRVSSLVLARLAPGFIALREHVRLIERIIFSARPNSLAILPLNLTVRKEYGALVFEKSRAKDQILEVFEVRQGYNRIEPLDIGLEITPIEQGAGDFSADRFTAYLDAERLSDLSVRTFRNGDRFFPLGMKHSVKLKDYFISRKIPLRARRNVPLLISGHEIAWVIGERIDDRFRVTDLTKKTLRFTAQNLSTIF